MTHTFMRAVRFEKPIPDAPLLIAYAMRLEHQFVAAGGLLLAGPHPTGNGGVLPRFGDQREIELLVESRFSPVEAIRIAALNRAIYEGTQAGIGSIETGKSADYDDDSKLT
jgi:hypothetical protein